MRWFLDMCVILYHIGEGDKEIFIKKSQKFVRDKKEDKFVLCCYIKEDNIPKWLNRQRILFREAIRQISNFKYKPYSAEECKYLYERDKKKLLKLVTYFRGAYDKKEVTKKFENSYQEIEFRINSFLKEKIDEFVIPITEIDPVLKSHLLSFLNLGSPVKNDSDAKTLASAIQAHNQSELVIITADKTDWTLELLEEVKNHMDLKKKYLKLPEIRYLQSIN